MKNACMQASKHAVCVRRASSDCPQDARMHVYMQAYTCPHACLAWLVDTHQQVLLGDIVHLRERTAQRASLRVRIHVWEAHRAECLSDLRRRPVRVFVRVQLDDVLWLAAVALRQHLERLDWGVGRQLE
eukprot:366062-Chlamydomonas_euryale.AAC.2